MAVSLEKLGVQPGDTVADIGCGTGTVTKAI
ncbi:MAG TPA: class I SAM-dependent methyltransferase, partial [Methanocorpusculum sp.]|nr:class I SAM-dependent methyltransferase [Methanocorpusculum sp.]